MHKKKHKSYFEATFVTIAGTTVHAGMSRRFSHIFCMVVMLSVVTLAMVSTAFAADYPKTTSIREALGEAIRINAETKAAMGTSPFSTLKDKLTGHKSENASPDASPIAPAAKTKSFAYTSISAPTVA